MFRPRLVVEDGAETREVDPRLTARRGLEAGREASRLDGLAAVADCGIRQMQGKIAGKAGRGVAGEIAKRNRAGLPASL